MSREFKSRDKKVQKMTKDGLVEINQSTGEESRISQRGQDFQLGRSQPESGSSFGSRPPADDSGRSHRGRHHPEPDAGTATPSPYETGGHQEPGPDAGPTSHNEQAAQESRPSGDFSRGPASSVPEGADSPRQGGRRPLTSTKYGQPETPLETGRPPGSHSPDAEPASPKQRGTKYSQRFAQETAPADSLRAEPASDKAAEPSVPTSGAKPSRLQFSKDELPPGVEPAPDKKLDRARYKAEAAHAKLDAAREKLPTKREIKVRRVYDEQKGKAKAKLEFEKRPLARGEQVFKPPAIVRKPAAAVKGGIGAAGRTAHLKLHQKIYQAEDENVGVKAGHRAEIAGEGALRMGRRAAGKAYRFAKDAPYRTVEKLEKQAVKANVKFSYRKALAENPQLKSNVLSRMMQKRKIQRAYAKAARDAKKAGSAAKKTGSAIGNALKAVGSFVKNHPAIAGGIALLLLLLFFIMSMFGSCSNMASGVMSGVVASSYVAEDADIDNAELSYTEWETDLYMEAMNAEADYPGYDEYRWNVGDISHDPFELMAYLTAVYQDFQYADVESDLRQIFGQQYQLTFTPEVEIRTRMVEKTRSVYDPVTGDYLGEETYEEEEEYEWHVLNIALAARSFSDVVSSMMDPEQAEMFEVYMQTKGNRQYLVNPFAFNWLPYVSDYYGWRVHPITGAKDYHKAIDIAVPQGTEILAGHDGVVTTATSHSSYGLYVVIEGENGLVSKYAHCSQLLVSAGQEVKQGDVIAKVGSTGDSTGAHLHLEVIKNGQYLNPIFFAETGDDGSGRIPPGSPGGVDYPDYPGTPLGDGSYAALIAEAELHLGKKYVFGASGPANFDCSGYVSWVLDKSGVKPMSRTNAQGLFNMSTPVSPENAQPGDLIFFTGTYSTPNACSHVGIYVGGGQMIHCGDPIQYTSINSSYWQSHFYSFARIN